MHDVSHATYALFWAATLTLDCADVVLTWPGDLDGDLSISSGETNCDATGPTL